jgi:hypothetical protein
MLWETVDSQDDCAVARGILPRMPKIPTVLLFRRGAEKRCAQPSLPLASEVGAKRRQHRLGGHERLATAQRRQAQAGFNRPEAQRKVMEDHDYVFHDPVRYERAADEATALPEKGR